MTCLDLVARQTFPMLTADVGVVEGERGNDREFSEQSGVLYNPDTSKLVGSCGDEECRGRKKEGGTTILTRLETKFEMLLNWFLLPYPVIP